MPCISNPQSPDTFLHIDHLSPQMLRDLQSSSSILFLRSTLQYLWSLVSQQYVKIETKNCRRWFISKIDTVLFGIFDNGMHFVVTTVTSYSCCAKKLTTPFQMYTHPMKHGKPITWSWSYSFRVREFTPLVPPYFFFYTVFQTSLVIYRNQQCKQQITFTST